MNWVEFVRLLYLMTADIYLLCLGNIIMSLYVAHNMAKDVLKLNSNSSTLMVFFYKILKSYPLIIFREISSCRFVTCLWHKKNPETMNQRSLFLHLFTKKQIDNLGFVKTRFVKLLMCRLWNLKNFLPPLCEVSSWPCRISWPIYGTSTIWPRWI